MDRRLKISFIKDVPSNNNCYHYVRHSNNMDENTGKKLTALGGLDDDDVRGVMDGTIGKAGGGGNDTKSGTPDEQGNIKNDIENFEKISEIKNEKKLEDKIFFKKPTDSRDIKSLTGSFYSVYSIHRDENKQPVQSGCNHFNTGVRTGRIGGEVLRTFNLIVHLFVFQIVST